MKELLIYIAQSLVEHPESVSVTEYETPAETVLELRVAPADMGKVIGRQGRIAKTNHCIDTGQADSKFGVSYEEVLEHAKEIRALMRSVAQRQGKRISVDIVD